MAQTLESLRRDRQKGNILPKLGLLKVDFLGLRTLTIIDSAINLIKEKANPKFDIDTIDDCERIIVDIALGIGFRNMFENSIADFLIINSNFSYLEVDNIDRVCNAIRHAKREFDHIIIVSDAEHINNLIERRL